VTHADFAEVAGLKIVSTSVTGSRPRAWYLSIAILSGYESCDHGRTDAVVVLSTGETTTTRVFPARVSSF